MDIPQIFIPKDSSKKLEQLLDEPEHQTNEIVPCGGYDKKVSSSKLEIDKLNKAYDCVGVNGLLFDAIGKRIGNYESKDRLTTSDRYTWFWGLKFNAKKGGIAVLFPWCQNWSKPDGLQLDRPIETYIKGEVSMKEVGTVIESLYQEFQKLRYKP